MLKKITVFLLTIALVFSTSIFSFASSVDETKIKSNSWMQYLPDNAPITEVNLPGTHDAACRYFIKRGLVLNVTSPYAKTQSLSIPEQLKAGVRFMDCRICLRKKTDNFLTVPHNMTLTADKRDNGKLMKIDTIVSYAEQFVTLHPNEFVVLMIQEDGRTYDNESEKFKKLKNDLISSFKNSSKRAYLDLENQGNVAPTVGEMRGKVIAVKCGNLAGVNGYAERTAKYKWTNVLKPYFESVVPQNYDTPAYMNNNLDKASRPLTVNVPARGEKDANGKRILVGAPHPYLQSTVMNRLISNYEFKKGYFYGWFQMDYVNECINRKIYLTNNFK